MTKEELITIVNEAIEARLTTINQQPTTEEVVVNQGDSVSLNQGNEPTKPNEPVCKSEVCKSDEPSKEESTSCNETDKEDEPEKKDAKASEKDDEPEKKDEVIKDEVIKDEVIKEEVLNSAPTTSIPKVEEEWRNLNGKDLSKWIDEHRDAVMEYQRNWYSAR